MSKTRRNSNQAKCEQFLEHLHLRERSLIRFCYSSIPHSLYGNPNARICLITADPQRTYKDIVAHPSFPSELSSRIGRVIGVQKLKAKYKSYESRRQLLSEYDIFLADERIITYLPATLGKIFFKSTAKRPIPVRLTGNAKLPKDADGKKIQLKKKTGSDDKGSPLAGTPAEVGSALQKALQTAAVHLSPSSTTAIRVAWSSFTPAQIADNVSAIIDGLVDRFIPQGWRNIRGIHIKGPNTAALPIWLASELWVDEQDVLDEKFVEVPREKKAKGKKRAATETTDTIQNEPDLIEAPPAKKSKKSAVTDDLSQELAQRKEKLKKQKEEVLRSADRPAGKIRKAVAVA